MSNVEIKSGDNVALSVATNNQQTLKVKEGAVNVAITGVVAGGDKNHVHDQSSASDTWVVTHNLHKRPSVSVVDSAGTQIICEVHYDSDNQVTLTFDDSTAGKAYFN